MVLNVRITTEKIEIYLIAFKPIRIKGEDRKSNSIESRKKVAKITCSKYKTQNNLVEVKPSHIRSTNNYTL